MDDSQKQQLIEQILSTPGGSAKIAASMRHPLFMRMQYKAVPATVLVESRAQIEGVTTTFETVHQASTWDELEGVQDLATQEHANMLTRVLIGHVPHIQVQDPFPSPT